MRGARARVVKRARGGTPGGMMASNTFWSSGGYGAGTGSTRVVTSCPSASGAARRRHSRPRRARRTGWPRRRRNSPAPAWARRPRRPRPAERRTPLARATPARFGEVPIPTHSASQETNIVARPWLLYGDRERGDLGRRDALLPGPTVLEAQLLLSRLERRQLPDLRSSGADSTSRALRGLEGRRAVDPENRVFRLDVDPAVTRRGVARQAHDQVLIRGERDAGAGLGRAHRHGLRRRLRSALEQTTRRDGHEHRSQAARHHDSLKHPSPPQASRAATPEPQGS